MFTHDDAFEYAASPEIRIFKADGTFRGTLNDLVRANTERSDSFTEKAAQYAEEVTDNVIGVELRIRPPLFAEDNRAKRYEIKLIRVYLEAREVSSAVQLKGARYRGASVAYGQGQSPEGEFAITLIQPTNGPTTGAMSVTNPKRGTVQTVDLRFPADGGRFAFITDPVHGKPQGSDQPKR